MAFGDSITESKEQQLDDRWSVLLENKLQQANPTLDIKVVNAGVGGNTSRNGVERIDRDVMPHKPDFVLVEFGNDVIRDVNRHVSLEEYDENFGKMFNKVVEENGGELIIMTFTPIVNEWHLSSKQQYFIEHGGIDANMESYREVTRKFAARNNCTLLDLDNVLREAMAKYGNDKIILPDGIHLTKFANQLVAEAVAAILQDKIARRC